jgi:ribonuclease HII
MQRLAPRHPGHGWDTNVGYGTEQHQVGLRLHGPTRHHRLTFEPLAQLTLFA